VLLHQLERLFVDRRAVLDGDPTAEGRISSSENGAFSSSKTSIGSGERSRIRLPSIRGAGYSLEVTP